MSESRTGERVGGFVDPTYVAVLDAVPDAMLVSDDSGRILLANQPALTLLGYERDDLIGMPVEHLVPVDLRSAHEGHRAAYLDEPHVHISGRELTARRGDGAVIPVEVSLSPLETDDGTLVVTILRDPGARRREERLFRGVLEAAPDAIVILDDLGHVLLVNAQAERMFGYERGRLIGQLVDKLVPHHPGLREVIRAGGRAHGPSRPLGMRGDLFARRKDGSEFAVEISLAPLETKEGRLVLAAVRDVTARMALEDANNRAKDEFFATVSHELRTPLTSLIGYGELMGDLEELSPQGSQFLSVMMRNAERELRLVDDLLTLVAIEDSGLSIRPGSVDLGAILRDAVESARPLAEDAGLELDLVLPAVAATSPGDPDRIGQAVDNLLSNAIKFTGPGGRVRAVLRVTDDAAMVEVVDTGGGIEETEQDLVFERLYRGSVAVERHVPGAGLGLPIALAIAKAHGGTIGITESSPKGSTFRMTLPREG